MAEGTKGIGALGIGSIVNAIPALFQGITGAIQASRGRKGFNRAMANRPDYQIPEEYKKILSQYQTAYGGDMPGYQRGLGQIEQVGARSRGAAERGAISSNTYGASVSAQQQKELDAIMNLNLQNEQFKLQGVDKIAGAEGAIAGQKEQQWNINKFLPWQTEMNRYSEMQKGGMQNLFGALQSGASNITDLIGTKYYTDALKGLQGGGSSGVIGGGGFQSAPLGDGYSPQNNLLDTTKKLLSGININHP